MNASCRKSFSLVELLVVVAVIAMLCSLLMPALSKAKETARSTQCLSNLRQMGTAMYLYAGDYNSFYATNLPGLPYWHSSFMGKLILNNSIQGQLSVISYRSATLDPEVSTRKTTFYHCPSQPNLTLADSLDGVSLGPFGDGGYYFAYGLALLHTDNLTKVKAPSQVLFLYDGTIFSSVLGTDISESGTYNNIFYNVNRDYMVKHRHNKGFNSMFIDGHAGWLKGREALTLDNFDGYHYRTYPAGGDPDGS